MLLIVTKDEMMYDRGMLENKKILITGSNGFIGYHLSSRLLKDVEGIEIIGVDNMNDYYDVRLKQERLNELQALEKNYTFIKGDISDKQFIDEQLVLIQCKISKKY